MNQKQSHRPKGVIAHCRVEINPAGLSPLPSLRVLPVAQRLSNLAFTLGCSVDSVLDGVDIFAEPGETAETVALRWRESFLRSASPSEVVA